MRVHEQRRCPLCGWAMYKVPDSERTTKDRVWFNLRCPCCGHVEVDWHERRNGRTY